MHRQRTVNHRENHGVGLVVLVPLLAYELTNLIGLESHRKVAETMWERLNRRMVAAGEPIAVIEPAEARKSGQRRVTDQEAQS